MIASADQIVKKGHKLLKNISIDLNAKYFYKLDDVLEHNEQALALYKIIISCIQEEFKDKPLLLERLITKIDQRLMNAFKKGHD